MKMLQIIGLIILAYIVIQAIWSGYFFNRAKTLTKTIYTGTRTLGNSSKPEFDILVDGDSVGTGVGASSFETSLAGRVALFYADKYQVKIVNNSVNGYQMQNLVDKTIPSGKRNLTLLVVSSNDLFHLANLQKFKVSTAQVLERYSKNSDKLIIIGPGRIFDAVAIPLVLKPIYKIVGNSYATILQSEAKKFPHIIYVNPLATEVSQKEYGYTNAYDGFHPNDNGYRFWFDLLKPHL